MLIRMLAVPLAALVLLSGPDAEAAEALAAGDWTNQSYDIAGSWSIERRSSETFVVLSGDFATRSAPDLKIFLSPKRPGEITDDNATEGSVLVGQLPDSDGMQELALPAGVALDGYQSIVLHCERFSKLWGAGPLR